MIAAPAQSRVRGLTQEPQGDAFGLIVTAIDRERREAGSLIVGEDRSGGPRGARVPAAGFGIFACGIVVSRDNIVYVADRSNRRVQLFTPGGKYLAQMFVNRAGSAPDTVSGFALSGDKNQQFLYIADYGNSRIVVVDRKKLAVLYQLGKKGAAPGDFQGLHHIAADSKGDLYAAEVAPGARIQRFVFKGLSSTLPPGASKP